MAQRLATTHSAHTEGNRLITSRLRVDNITWRWEIWENGRETAFILNQCPGNKTLWPWKTHMVITSAANASLNNVKGKQSSLDWISNFKRWKKLVDVFTDCVAFIPWSPQTSTDAKLHPQNLRSHSNSLSCKNCLSLRRTQRQRSKIWNQGCKNRPFADRHYGFPASWKTPATVWCPPVTLSVKG